MKVEDKQGNKQVDKEKLFIYYQTQKWAWGLVLIYAMLIIVASGLLITSNQGGLGIFGWLVFAVAIGLVLVASYLADKNLKISPELSKEFGEIEKRLSWKDEVKK